MHKSKVRNAKISRSLKGNTNRKGSKLSQKTKNKISLALKGRKNLLLGIALRGRKLTKEHINKIQESRKGYRHSEETRKKISKANRGRGQGKTDESKIWRKRVEYRLWREAVFARDNWTCQKCSNRGGIKLHPHHIRNFAEEGDLRFAIDNGITFCIICHRKFHQIYGNTNNDIDQIEEFTERIELKCGV